ncbi:MAG: hypothetical protein ABIJ34_09365 [archaeon]
MEIKFGRKEIVLIRKINDLDLFTLSFVKFLDLINIKYVIISGYVAILFGRSRNSEDIDVFIEEIDYKTFLKFWEKVYSTFYCLATDNPKTAYFEYLSENTALRFAEKGQFIPNMEIKFVKNELDNWSLTNRLKAKLKDDILYISPLELQIAFKLFLGTEKDIEDAKHLFNMLKENLNMNVLMAFNEKLKTVDSFNRYLK